MAKKPLYDVITCGSATVDAFAKTKADLITINLADLKRELIVYPSGSKIMIKDLEFQTGGGGTNTAVAFSRLGLKTAYLGNIGADANGDRIINMLKREKIDFIGTKGKEMTNYSIILDSVKQDRTILAYKGASMHLLYRKIDISKVNSRWIYFSSLLGRSYLSFKKLLDLASKRDIKVAFNPSSYLASSGLKRLSPILKKVHLLVFNREEANILFNVKNESMSIKEMMKRLHLAGPKIVIITDGGKGAYCSDGKNILHAIPSKVKIVETTGAGDAFASSFLAGMMMYEKRLDAIKRSLSLAVTNAASVIGSYGAKNILLSRRA
ncbi:carbohydrate kinase family protein, partial [Candidatus Woesearchaeota archaeon CG08_land_8_20_14_0_20_43_7]